MLTRRLSDPCQTLASLYSQADLSLAEATSSASWARWESMLATRSSVARDSLLVSLMLRSSSPRAFFRACSVMSGICFIVAARPCVGSARVQASSALLVHPMLTLQPTAGPELGDYSQPGALQAQSASPPICAATPYPPPLCPGSPLSGCSPLPPKGLHSSRKKIRLHPTRSSNNMLVTALNSILVAVPESGQGKQSSRPEGACVEM
ncbi:MAG: hypothetical protein FRX49_06986 [Trebouxia sp. A1-2]|nr:MAG: hypothetical protein FRX49_06986 [Trebouxia sp. A1-2]